jgi:P-type Cu+ transporter
MNKQSFVNIADKNSFKNRSNDSQGKEYVDPVCMMSTTDKDAYIPYDYKGITYYFCNPKCLDKFKREPEKYIPNLSNQTVSFTPFSQISKKTVEYVDPVCMMRTTDKEAYTPYEYKGTTYYFCNPKCLEKFKREPDKYIPNLTKPVLPMTPQPMEMSGSGKGTYTCPMDPEIITDGPGICPKCGMALEPMAPSMEEEVNP